VLLSLLILIARAFSQRQAFLQKPPALHKKRNLFYFFSSKLKFFIKISLQRKNFLSPQSYGSQEDT